MVLVSNSATHARAEDRHGRTAADYWGAAAVQQMHFYGDLATGARLAESWGAKRHVQGI